MVVFNDLPRPDDRRNTVEVIAQLSDDSADEWLTRPQVAAMLGVSISALSRRVRRGRDENGVCAPPSYKYPGHKNGTKRRWRKSDVLKWIEEQRKGE